MKRRKHTYGATDEARHFKTSVLKVLAITSVGHGCKRGLNKSFTMSLFLLAQVKCFGDFFHDAQIKKVLIGLFEDL